MSNNVYLFQKRKSHCIITVLLFESLFFMSLVLDHSLQNLSINLTFSLSHTHMHARMPIARTHAHTRAHTHTHTHTYPYMRAHSHLIDIYHCITCSILPEQSQSAGEVFTCSCALPTLPQSTVHQTSPSPSILSITLDSWTLHLGPLSPHGPSRNNNSAIKTQLSLLSACKSFWPSTSLVSECIVSAVETVHYSTFYTLKLYLNP